MQQPMQARSFSEKLVRVSANMSTSSAMAEKASVEGEQETQAKKEFNRKKKNDIQASTYTTKIVIPHPATRRTSSLRAAAFV